MRAGDLRNPVVIQQYSDTPDSYGSGTRSWSTYKSCWAAMWPQKGDEQVLDGQMVSVARYIFRIRYISGITTAMRILYNSRVFEILNVRNKDERNRTMDLLCKEYE